MSIEILIFVVVLAATLFNNGIQAYIHFEAYPLFAYVGRGEFSTYLTEYERRLTIPLVLPYLVTVLSNIALLFLRPDDVPLIGVVVVLILNLAVSITTLMLANPVYNQIKQGGVADSAAMSRLMNINLLRLVLSTLASLVLLYLLIDLLNN